MLSMYGDLLVYGTFSRVQTILNSLYDSPEALFRLITSLPQDLKSDFAFILKYNTNAAFFHDENGDSVAAKLSSIMETSSLLLALP
ncbi:hypothetical protein Fmac_014131 [Flemingia macrophylla]|uniref:Uncharacterized protein n=1 Tax=Flemingia macrophylla TaxID=520843 RepID=A0ABD1MAU6_9FABA